MPRYSQGNVSFDPPKDWEDVTIAAFSPRADPKQPMPPSVKMWREPLPEGVSLRQHANRMIVQLARELTGFDLVENEELVVADRPATRIRCRFKSKWGPVEQNRVMVDPGNDPERVVTTFFLASRLDESEKARPILDDVLKSVKFESKDGGQVRRYGAVDAGAAAQARPTTGQVPVAPGDVYRGAQGAPAAPPMVAPPTIAGPPSPQPSDNPSFMPPSMPMPGRQR